MIAEAFVYCWTDHATNKLYIGWHKGSVDDGYICSSKYMKEQYIQRPHDFTRQIVAAGTTDDMINFETVLLRSSNAKSDDQFYNMHNNGPNFVHNQPHTEETKRKLKQAHKKRTKYARGWKFTEEQKKNHKAGLRNYWDNLSQEERKKAALSRESDKKKSSLAKMNQIVATCPHCNKSGNYGAMKRWHFDNCGLKNGSN